MEHCGKIQWMVTQRLASENPDLKIVQSNTSSREPRVKMSYDPVARTLLGIEKMSLTKHRDTFRFSLDMQFTVESQLADPAQLAIDYGRPFGMDVNDNYRSWDDDLIAGAACIQ